MYKQVKKPKENNRRAINDSVNQKKINAKPVLGFVDNRPEPTTQRILHVMANNYTAQQRTTADIGESNGTIQRQISIVDPARQIGWYIAYFDYIYPRLTELMLDTGAAEGDINMLLKKYDQDDTTFATPEKLLEILKQELIIKNLEDQVEDNQEYFDSHLEFLCVHEPLVFRFKGFLSEMYLEGDFNEAIRSKDLLNALKVTTTLLEQVVSENTTPDEEMSEGMLLQEEVLISDYGLDTCVLYRAEDIHHQKIISKSSFPLYGFFSTSFEYSKQYYQGGSKGNYNSMIKITLAKPIGNVLIELLRSREAFKQNSGNIGRVLAKASGAKSDQKSVYRKLQKDGLLGKNGKLTKGFRRNMIGGASRNNVPNSVMIKQEPDANTELPIANIEITSRIEDGEGLLIEHPLDKYVIKIERMNPDEIN